MISQNRTKLGPFGSAGGRIPEGQGGGGGGGGRPPLLTSFIINELKQFFLAQLDLFWSVACAKIFLWGGAVFRKIVKILRTFFQKFFKIKNRPNEPPPPLGMLLILIAVPLSGHEDHHHHKLYAASVAAYASVANDPTSYLINPYHVIMPNRSLSGSPISANMVGQDLTCETNPRESLLSEVEKDTETSQAERRVDDLDAVTGGQVTLPSNSSGSSTSSHKRMAAMDVRDNMALLGLAPC